MASLVVDQLQFQPLGTPFEKLVDNLKSATEVSSNTGTLGIVDKLKLKVRGLVNSLDNMQSEGCLADVSFVAKPGEFTAVIGPDEFELKTIAELIGSGRTSGIFDGQAYVTAKDGLSGAADVAFVAADAYKLYIPGLTYYQTVRYNALLRVKDISISTADVDKAVLAALDLMGLSRYRNRVIPERPITRGLLGGELRSLRIAADIALMPPVIVLEEPIQSLDFGVAVELLKRLRSLADLGRTVVCTFHRPDNAVYEVMDAAVVVVHGRTVFASRKENLIPHFTSGDIGYVYNPDHSSVIDFIMDITTGVERPTGQRLPPTALDLQTKFELNSEFCEYKTVTAAGGVSFSQGGSNRAIALLPLTRPKPYLNLLVNNNLLRNRSLFGRRVYVAFERAVVTKLREYAILRKSLISNTMIGLLVGYFCYNQGNFGDYCMSMFNFPYEKVSNIASNLFIANMFVFLTQILNVHIICQKVSVFRSEQRGAVMTTGVFFLSTLMAEIPFSMFYASIFSTIVYFMIGYRSGAENYEFFILVQALVAALGVVLTLTFAATFVKEFLVRDLFLVFSFIMIMFSGFPFTMKVMRGNAVTAIESNPLRWSFESLMQWQFSPFKDGDEYLSSYSFNNFNHMDVFPIFTNFFLITGGILLLSLAPRPNFLRRKRSEEALTMARPESFDNRFSVDSDIEHSSMISRITEQSEPTIKTGKSQLVEASPSNRKRKQSLGTPRNSNMSTESGAPPVLFIRDAPSGAAQVSLSFRPSASLNIETDENINRGPTVTVQSLSFSVLDPRSPMGHRNILSDISAKFDWGKLCVILGAKDSGKSTLLHMLSGADNRPTTTIGGKILFDGRLPDPTDRPWHRGGYVEALDDHFRDLTVLDTVTYAMRLRCMNKDDMSEIYPNVQKTLALLRLTELRNVSAKLLSRGERRRLSIAEELVTGPNFVLLDEPVTNLNAKESALIMNSFRELVNQEKTVVTTMHEPSAEVFGLCDHLVLLSKGRVIYTGPVDRAVPFFADASSLRLLPKGYSNPADFLADISGCRLKNVDNDFCDTPSLVSNWKCSDLCAEEEEKIPKMVMDFNVNPLLDEKKVLPGSGHVSTGSTDGGQSKDRTYWSGTRSVDISTNKSSEQTSFNVVKAPSTSWFARSAFRDVDVKMTGYRMFTILEREVRAMLLRPKMVFASLLLQVLIGGTYGVMMKPTDASSDPGAVTSYFGFGAVLIMLTLVPLAYYLHNNYKVFKKEHSRGLYSMISYWLVGMLPLLVLRSVHFGIYTLLSHKVMGLQSGNVGRFYYLNMYCFQIAHTFLIMFFVYQATEVRSVYYSVPGISFVLFYFSGMVVKPTTLPSWAAPWMPSISIIRWFMQAGLINEGNDNPSLFPTINNFEIYKRYLGFFGWNGKTKYYCLYMAFLNIGIYFMMCLLAHFLAIRKEVGRRQLRVADEDDRLF